MEGVVLRVYHVVELGKNFLPEPLAWGTQCRFILCSGEFLRGLLEIEIW